MGNRLSSTGVPLYNYNSSNELTSNSNGSYTYDANGNALSDAQGRSYTWDFENRLTQAVVPGTNGGTTTFRYDPFRKNGERSVCPQFSKNVQELFDKSIADGSGTRWAKDSDGTIHRFSAPSNGESHWNGSTAGSNPIRQDNIPIEIRRALN